MDAFFQALAPAELNLLQEVLAAQQADRGRVAKLRADQLARAEYEAGLAQRHYQAVDPANRLVAAELERSFEVALQAVVEAREEMERMVSQSQVPELTEEMKEQLQDVGHYLPAMWGSGRLTPAHQKDILRSLIRRIIVTRPTPDTVEARIVWVSGAVTPFAVHPPIARGSDVSGYEQLVERILALGAQGYQDPEIARIVSAEGFRSARSAHIPASLVGEIRRARGQISLTEQFKTQAKVEGQWTIFGLAQELSVHRNWLYTRIHKGTLLATRHSVTGHYLIADEPEILATLRAQRDRCCYR